MFMVDIFTLQDLDGNTLNLYSLRGKPIVVNLWASWCSPCRSEMKTLESAYQRYKDQGLQVVAVNMTYQDNPDTVRSFTKSEGLSFPVALDTEGDVNSRYQVQGLPSTYFVDRHGKIVSIVIGGPMSEALLRSQIEQILKEPR